MTHPLGDCDLSFVLRTRDDEERIGYGIQRLCAHLRGMNLRFELLVVDEDSGDNTLAIAALVRSRFPEVEVHHAEAGQAYVVGAERARGRVVVASDLRNEAPLAALAYALGRVERGLDVVALGGRFLVFRRTRGLRALDALAAARRDSRAPLGDVERRFVRRARAVGLSAVVTHRGRRAATRHLLGRWLRHMLDRRPTLSLPSPLSFLL